MKKLNELSPKRQKQLLITVLVLYALLLTLSLGHNQVTIKPGYVPHNIGHTLDSLTHKK